jgi:hypothetical protein
MGTLKSTLLLVLVYMMQDVRLDMNTPNQLPLLLVRGKCQILK